MRSHLLEGTVRHRRARPFDYALEHDVYYLALDLAELDEVDAAAPARQPQSRATSCRSVTPTTWPPPVADLRSASSSNSARRALDPAGWRITLVTNLRVLGLRIQPGQLLPVPGRGAAHCVSSSSRSTTRTASDTCTRCGRAGDVGPFVAVDGQGVLRVAVHRHGRRLHGPRPGRCSRGCGSRSTSARTGCRS